jgi:hypothetical protein
MQVIQQIELGSSQQTIEFINVPATFTDLVLLVSARVDGSIFAAINDDTKLVLNGSTSNFSYRNLFGEGGSVFSDTWDGRNFSNNSQSTANTFSNMQIYVPNYRSAVAKSFSVESAVQTNSSSARQLLAAGLWNVTSPITSIGVRGSYGLFVAGSSATLYGILRGSSNGVTVS